MVSTLIYSVVLCFLICNHKVLGFNAEGELFSDESDSSENEQRYINTKQAPWNNMNNFGSGYSKDNFNVYFMGKKVPDTSVISFETVGRGYAKDNWSVYYRGEKMQGVSPSSFSINHFG
ncbi:unnamed protein product [Rotaria socialis]|uniref:Uncharacterized protein n=1 Tax=Rotaria socialis TaxID=392032 RepID=A0A817UTN8_9BILA|nr:unnamed protein product [Rotaria socialis]CAF3432954.1 unnamed protein product [Rotaria socialis]